MCVCVCVCVCACVRVCFHIMPYVNCLVVGLSSACVYNTAFRLIYMSDVSARGVDERMTNVHYYYFNHTDRLVRPLPFDDHGLHIIITERPKYEARPS